MKARRWKRTVLALVASLIGAACGAAGPAPAAAGQTVRLKAGESALARDGTLRFGFEAGTADSRCPQGEQCVSAGDATARVWLQRGAGPRQTFELHTAPGPAQAVRVQEHELRLLRLVPLAVAGRRAARGDAVATLSLSRGRAAPSQR